MIFPPDSPPHLIQGVTCHYCHGNPEFGKYSIISEKFEAGKWDISGILPSETDAKEIFQWALMQMKFFDTQSVLFSSRCSNSRRRCRHNTLILIPPTSLCPLNIHMKPHSAKSPQIMVHFLPTISCQGPEKYKFPPLKFPTLIGYHGHRRG